MSGEQIQEGALVRLKSGTEGWIKAQVVEYFDLIPSVGGMIYTGPGYKVRVLEGKHKDETIKVPANYVELLGLGKAKRETLYPHIPKKKEPLFPHVPKGRQPEIKLILPQTHRQFVQVGERVRFIGSSRGRYETWPKDAWLEKGVTGTVKEYHPEQPAVRVGGEYFEALRSYAVVRWDFGGDTVIDPDDEGKRWEIISKTEVLPQAKGKFEIRAPDSPGHPRHSWGIYSEGRLIEEVRSRREAERRIKEWEEGLRKQHLPATKDKIEAFEDVLDTLAEKYKTSTTRIARILLGHDIRSIYGLPDQKRLDAIIQEGLKEQNLPQTRSRKPTRHDVEIGTWVERDRMGIWITDKRTDKTIAEWWDEDAQEMFDQGFFKPGDIRQQTITGRAFEESVLDYAESVGIIAGAGKLLPQVAKTGYYWTAINKGTGEITESTVPYTSPGRALRGGRAFASRHWKGDEALVEVWKEPYRYSSDLKIQPVATERLGATLSPQTTFERGTDYYKVPPEAY